MNAKELRIGNYVNIGLKSSGLRTDYDAITASGLMDLQVNKERSSFIYEPIPLTEEWLVKFGFKKDDEDDYCFKGFHVEDRNLNLSLPIDKMLRLKDGFGCWSVGGYLRDVKYVHQLQNLYFTLINEELKLK
jgi:hypothetical protein